MKVRHTLRPVARGTLLAAAVGLALCGCSQGMASPAHAAAEFDEALAGGDYARACELLTPKAVSELEDSSGEPCESALQSLDIPAGGAVVHVEAWGRAAIAEMDQDVLFLARTGETWAVRAAGCTPVPDAPYDCTVTGG